MATPIEINEAVGTVLKGAKDLKSFTKLASRKSIMTMAQPGMYQYPILISSAIDTDVIAAISKAYQLTYAANVATAYSLNPIMWLKDTKEVSDFVQKFHQNDPSFVPNNLDAAGRALGVESATEVEEDIVTVESATVDTSMNKEDLLALSLNAWDNVEDAVTMESLNDMYRPYDRTRRIMEEKLETLKVANEAVDDFVDRVTGRNDYSTTHPASQRVQNTSSKETRDGKGNVTRSETTTTRNRQPIQRNFDAQIVKNNQLEAMEPTMINVTVLCHGKTEGSFTQNITIGVKTMPRVISSELMITSMTEVCQNNHKVFRFLKWTKGEIKTLDALLGISNARKKVLEKNAKQEVKLINQAKKRKGNSILQRFLGNEVMPTLTIVITDYEAAMIKESCHVDLNNLSEAVRLMNKYFLLSFGIYDTKQNTLKVLFDCDEDWAYTTIGNLRSNTNKVNDVLSQNAVLGMFGRR